MNSAHSPARRLFFLPLGRAGASPAGGEGSAAAPISHARAPLSLPGVTRSAPFEAPLPRDSRTGTPRSRQTIQARAPRGPHAREAAARARGVAATEQRRRARSTSLTRSRAALRSRGQAAARAHSAPGQIHTRRRGGGACASRPGVGVARACVRPRPAPGARARRRASPRCCGRGARRVRPAVRLLATPGCPWRSALRGGGGVGLYVPSVLDAAGNSPRSRCPQLQGCSSAGLGC